MEILFQIGASLLILIPFVLLQVRRLRSDSAGYLVPNLMGSAALAIDAFVGRQWGFLLLEAVWAIVSVGGLIRLSRNKRSTRE